METKVVNAVILLPKMAYTGVSRSGKPTGYAFGPTKLTALYTYPVSDCGT